jgi:hypothetical protein
MLSGERPPCKMRRLEIYDRCLGLAHRQRWSRAANYNLQPFTASLQRVKGLCNYMQTACGHVSRVICIRLQP